MKARFAGGILAFLLFSAPATYTISGTIHSSAPSVYSLIRRDETSSSAVSLIRSLPLIPCRDRFDIPGATAGTYDLYVLSSDKEGRQMAGSVHVQIKSSNLNGITIDLKPFVDIKGHFLVNREMFTERGPRISLKPKTLPAPYWMQSMAVADEDGAFTLFDIAQGTYAISISGLTSGNRVNEVHLQGRLLQPSDTILIDGDESQSMEIVVDRIPFGPPNR